MIVRPNMTLKEFQEVNARELCTQYMESGAYYDIDPVTFAADMYESLCIPTDAEDAFS